MDTLYSIAGSYPAPLPFRIRLSNGMTRTDPETFTPKEIEGAGYTEVQNPPEHDPETQRVDWDAGMWVIRPKLPNPPQPLSISNIASAKLEVVDGELLGMERALGMSMAMMLDESTAWLFFSEPQEDTDYLVTSPDQVIKYREFVEIIKPNAQSIQVLVQRLQ